MEVRWDLGGAEMQFPAPRMRWGGTCMKVRPTPWALDRGEMGPAWSWDAILGTWMAVRRDLHGGETCMEVRHESWDPYAGQTGPGWRWDTHPKTWMGMTCDLDGCEKLSWDLNGVETKISGNLWRIEAGLVTWIWVRGDLNGDAMLETLC